MFRCIPLLALCGAAVAAPGSWTVARTNSFEVYSDAGPQTVRSTIEWFEELRAFFLRQTGLNVSGRAPVRVIVFRTGAEYEAYRPNPAAAAFYTGDASRDYIVMTQSTANWEGIAAHEYAHSLMHANGLLLPPWLSEGVAEVYSTVHIEERTSWIGGDSRPRSQTLAREAWIALRQLLATTEIPKNGVELFYAESWALAHMLAFSPEYGPRFTALLKTLSSGMSAEQALSLLYSKSVQAVDSDLHAWVAGGPFRAVAFAGIAHAAAPETAEVSSFEQRRLLADLFFVSGALPRAESLYKELQREAPGDSDVAIALGEIALRRADKRTAMREWKPAIAKGAHDPKLCYRYAALAQQTGMPDADIIPVLQRAVALDPAFDDARYSLALMLISAGRYGDGVTNLKAMRTIAPARAYSYWSAMANALTELDRREEAKAAAVEARRHASTSEERAHAAELAYIAETDLTVQFTRDASGATHMVTTRAPHNGPAWNPFIEPGDRMRHVEATLENIECGEKTRIVVKSDNAALRLTIVDPTRVQMRNAPPEFTCGPQSARVAIDYAAQDAGGPNGDGIVRSMDFK